ncbi:MAG TPA: organomercurial lyase, partial [bacterium]|nr:organomercurial lyase [bacterium]
MKLDDEVRELVYQTTVRTGRPPRAQDIAASFGCVESEVFDAFRRLRERKLLALARESGEIIMAPPFSAAPTPFQVVTAAQSYFANCVWDAYGIPAALHQDAQVESSCACCGDPMRLEVRGGVPVSAKGIAHFAV